MLQHTQASKAKDLQIALSENRLEEVKKILSINPETYEFLTNVEIIELLIKCDIELFDILRCRIDIGNALFFTTNNGISFLLYAMVREDKHTKDFDAKLECLIQKYSLDINSKTNANILFYACSCSKLEILQSLSKHGADFKNLKDENNFDALDYAIINNNTSDIIQFLIKDEGLKLDINNISTISYICNNNFDGEVISSLMDALCCPEYYIENDIRILRVKAAIFLNLINHYVKNENDESLETIKLLLSEKKLDIHSHESLNFTNLDNMYQISKHNGILHEVLEMFKQDNYCVALHEREKLLEVIQLLIDAGADINEKDQEYNKTPLQCVIVDEHYINEDASIIKLLLENGAILSNAACYVVNDDLQTIYAKNEMIKNEMIKRGYEGINHYEENKEYVISISNPEVDLYDSINYDSIAKDQIRYIHDQFFVNKEIAGDEFFNATMDFDI